MHGHAARRLEVERARIDHRPAPDPRAAQRPRRRPQVLRVARAAENEPYRPEAIFHSPFTLTNFIRASSLSLFHFSPVGVATA